MLIHAVNSPLLSEKDKEGIGHIPLGRKHAGLGYGLKLKHLIPEPVLCVCICLCTSTYNVKYVTNTECAPGTLVESMARAAINLRRDLDGALYNQRRYKLSGSH